MGTTAEKLTYLNDTKEDLKEIINYTGANIGTNDTFRSYASKLKQGYLDILNNGIDTLYNNFPKVSGIGSNLSLTPTYKAPIKLNEIQGNTLQNGTPTPSSPVPIQSVTGLQNVTICGKNLLPNLVTTQTKSGVEITKNSDGSLTFNNTATAGINLNINYASGSYIHLESGKKYTISITNNSGIYFRLAKVSDGTLVASFDTPTKQTTFTSSYTGDVFAYLTILNGTSFSNLTIYPQIEVGPQATTYEPYKGNTYEVNLGKNLLDYSTLQDGYITNTGTINSSHPLGEMHSDFIKVQPNTTYTFKIFEISGTEYANWMGIGEYTANNISSFVRRDTMNTETQRYFTFTTSATTQYVIVSARNLENATKVQLEKGNGTSYSPYFTPIELNKIGDYKDSIKKSTGKNIWCFKDSDLYRLDANSYNILGNNSVEVTSTSGTWRSVKFLLNVPDGTYTFSVGNVINSNSSVTNKRMTLSTFTNNGATRTVVKHINMGTPETITIANETDKIYALEFYSGHDVSLSNTATYKDVMVISGSTSLPYEPYGKVWYKTYNSGEKTFNGSETWETQWNGDNIHGWRTTIPNLKQTTSGSQSSYVISDYYETRTQDENFSTGNYGISNRANQSQIIIKNNDILNQNDFITWLGTHNVKVKYVLATPIYEVITNTELINQLESLYNAKSEDGTTNINVTSENLAMLLNVGVIKGDA